MYLVIPSAQKQSFLYEKKNQPVRNPSEIKMLLLPLFLNCLGVTVVFVVPVVDETSVKIGRNDASERVVIQVRITDIVLTKGSP